jgi:hypothetical protein
VGCADADRPALRLYADFILEYDLGAISIEAQSAAEELTIRADIFRFRVGERDFAGRPARAAKGSHDIELLSHDAVVRLSRAGHVALIDREAESGTRTFDTLRNYRALSLQVQMHDQAAQSNANAR